MHRAEAGRCDDVGQVCVRMLSVSEVEVSLGDVNHLRLLHRQRANAARHFQRQLVLHRENMEDHRLDHREEEAGQSDGPFLIKHSRRNTQF